MLGIATPDAQAVEQALGCFRIHAAILEGHLQAHRYLVADASSLADFAVGSTSPYAADAWIPLEEFPAIRPRHERLNELPAWREPFPVA